MPRYYVEMRVDFAGEIEAESRADAEDKAWTAWGENADAELQYDGVYSIEVEELDDEEDEDDD